MSATKTSNKKNSGVTIERKYYKTLFSIYAVVTNDDYEIPLCVGPLHECAEYMGVTMSGLRSLMYYHRRNISQSWSGEYRIVDLKFKERIIEDGQC